MENVCPAQRLSTGPLGSRISRSTESLGSTNRRRTTKKSQLARNQERSVSPTSASRELPTARARPSKPRTATKNNHPRGVNMRCHRKCQISTSIQGVPNCVALHVGVQRAQQFSLGQGLFHNQLW